MKHFSIRCYWTVIITLLILGCSGGDSTLENPQQVKSGEIQTNKWVNLSSDEVYHTLEGLTDDKDKNIDNIVSGLSKNENVETVYNDGGVNLVVKMKSSDVVTIYPMQAPKDPFGGSVGAQVKVLMSQRQPARAGGTYKRKIAVFNYFSNMSDYSEQNSVVNWMMSDFSNYSTEIESYSYGTSANDFTIANLEKVIENSSSYKAIIIMSHGAYMQTGSGNGSFIAVSDKWTEADRYKDGAADGKTENEHEGWVYRIWNYGSFDKTYNKAYRVSKINTHQNCILYLGACEAFAKKGILPNSTFVGWDGKNCTAQAHAAVIFDKMLHGKPLIDVLDDAYGQSWSSDKEEDIWKQDPEGANMVYQLKGPYTSFDARIEAEPTYYKNGKPYLYFLNDAFRGSMFPSKSDFTFSATFRGIDDESDIPDQIYVWVRPMRQGATMESYKVKRSGYWSKENKFTQKISLKKKGVYKITASTDESNGTPIRTQWPIYMVYSDDFATNGQDIDATLESTLLILDGDNPVEQTLIGKSESKQFKINEEPSRSFKVSSVRSDIATASVSGNILTVTGQREGQTTITVTDSENSGIKGLLTVIVGEDGKSRITIEASKTIGEEIALGFADAVDVWVDLNNNGSVDSGEAVSNSSGLTWFYGKIASQSFTIYGSMNGLDCHGQKLTRLDLSRYYNQFYFLDCQDNELESLDLSTVTNLKILWCYANKLTSINCLTLNNLETLYCYNNQLTDLDVSQCTQLQVLDCFSNQLRTLKLPKTTTLKKLVCRDNKIAYLDVTDNSGLLEINCVNNQLESLNVGYCRNLEILLCDINKLSQLNLQNNQQLTCIGCNDNLFEAAALNAIYQQLPDINGKSQNRDDYSFPQMFKMLRSMPNPGYSQSNYSIAENKGWILRDMWDYSSAPKKAPKTSGAGK